MYDFGNPSKVGQKIHFHGQPKDFVNKEITVTQLRLLIHLFLSIFLKNKFSSKVQSAIKFNEIVKKFLQNLINNALQNR